MLLQSLIATTSSDGDCAAVASLTAQLAEVTAACDSLMLELVRIADQRMQIQRVQEVHVSSALAMALRKLNASYAKRTGELRDAREQIAQLQGELEEAWKVAEDMAQEMDDLDNFETGFSSPSEPDDDDTHIEESVRLAEVIGVTGKAVAMRATLTQLHTNRLRERETERERERDVPEHAGNGRRAEDALEAGPVEVDDGDERGADHADGDDEVLARAPERVRLQDRDAAVAHGEEAAVLHEHHRHVAGARGGAVSMVGWERGRGEGGRTRCTGRR